MAVVVSYWCEHCRDHFEMSHYIDGDHGIGPGFGPMGRLLEIEVTLKDLVRLKNGPRDAAYEIEKKRVWIRARQLVEES